MDLLGLQESSFVLKDCLLVIKWTICDGHDDLLDSATFATKLSEFVIYHLTFSI